MYWRCTALIGIMASLLHVPLAWLLAIVVSPYPGDDDDRLPDRRRVLRVAGEPRAADEYIAIGASELSYYVWSSHDCSMLVLERRWGWPNRSLRAAFDTVMSAPLST